ncbi:hypothetical protein KY289_007598 [Solanum tuberosum]|nr:hypothetical protein KY289_007598 [Solanum tuberosum]
MHGRKSAELATTSSSPERSKIEENTIVGMQDDFNTKLDRVTSQIGELTVIPIFGMGSIGKKTLAKKVYDDSYNRSRFDKHAWVTISQEYNKRQMLLEIASSITGSNQERSNDELMEIVYRGLKGRRFLIVLDDIWSTEAWDQMQRIFPNDDNKSRILLTTRLKYVADYVNCPDFPPYSFPEDREINVSRLIRLWISEQFVKARNNKRLEVVAEEYVEELIDRSLILTGRQSPNGRMRSCKIHDLLRQMCVSKAHTENVLHVMNGDALKAIDDQRRVILVSNVEKKHDYRLRHSSGIIRTFISMVVAFPKGMCSRLKLLKVLDVLSIEYNFSCVIPELVHLRYVALILRLDIWTMSEIRHVDSEFPLYISNPLVGEQPLFLNNLQTLYFRHTPFVAEIIRRSPNLKKLKILDDSEHPDWPAILDSLSLLQDLETLHIKTERNIDPMIISGDIFLPNLNKLTLTRTHIPWEVGNLLANLPNIEVLKGYRAFDGTYWKVDEDVVFHKLKYLQLYGPYDLERWELAAGSDNFPMLEQLLLQSFTQLEEILESIGDIMTLKFIQIYFCSSVVEDSAKKIQEEQESLGNYELQFITPKVC